ncbi:MAG TPA: nucleotide pyrophosphatase/phosphodiesterase family protein [Candidatus Dormibacteraeota bacterium]
MSLATAAPPQYGSASLADLMPSLMQALGVPGFVDALGVEPSPRVALLVIDSLGLELVRKHAAQAPFLASLLESGRPLSSGFPSSTAVSLSSLGTGRTPGEHGIVGFTMAVPGYDRSVNMLRWALHGGSARDLIEEIVPERFQDQPTAFERAAAAGVEVSLVGPVQLAHTGLTRAVFRGGRYRNAFSLGDLAAETVSALSAGARTFVYAYSPELDSTGHVRGVDSEAWRLHLGHVDRLAADIASSLPPDSILVVTGDHGMIDVPAAGRYDTAQYPQLRHGVRFLGGEPRARHVYAQPGAEAEVLAAWRELLGESMWILTREEAIAAGWFGPTVPDRVRPRIGDVVAAAFGPVGVTEQEVFKLEALLIGHHGSLTPDEQLVPFLLVRR